MEGVGETWRKGNCGESLLARGDGRMGVGGTLAKSERVRMRREGGISRAAIAGELGQELGFSPLRRAPEAQKIR